MHNGPARYPGPERIPPSAVNSLPVEYDDSSEARNATSRETSAGSAIRASGMDLRKAWASAVSMSSAWASTMPVSTPPGWTELTRMPRWPSSWAADLVIPRIANLLAL